MWMLLENRKMTPTLILFVLITVGPPKTPPGVEPCTQPIMPSGSLQRTSGETVRYDVNVNGLQVGTMDFKIERNGDFNGKQVTEYRSLFDLDSLVAAFTPMAGRAAALVPFSSHWPIHATTRYASEKNRYQEDMQFDVTNKKIHASRIKNAESSTDDRELPYNAFDMASGFYLLRTFPRDMRGCVMVYGNARIYTVWVRPDGQEDLQTVAGTRPTDRYQAVYGSDKSAKVIRATFWMSTDTYRLPYKVILTTDFTLTGKIRLFELGKS
jgi:hypothetical protein